MVDIYSFKKALKVNWVKILLLQLESQWSKRITEIIGTKDNIDKLGGEYCNNIIRKMKIFWQNVFKYWRLLCKNQPMNSNSDILQSRLWFKTQISLEPFYYLSWAKKQILFVGDLVKPNGKIMKPSEIENIYRLKVNSFYHYRVKSLINIFMKKYKKRIPLSLYNQAIQFS